VIDVSGGFSSWIEIEPVSPVFIGSGEKIEKFETIVEKNTMYILDFQKLLTNDDFVELFIERIQDILDPSKKDKAMKKIFQELKELKKLNLKLSEVFLGTFQVPFRNNKPVNLQMKRFVRSAGRYYVPGSSIKGAIRTALIKSDQNLVRHFEDHFEDHLKKRNINIEMEIFGRTNQSPFRLLEISDSDFIDKEFVKFKLITVRNLLKTKASIPMILELWLDNKDESNKNKDKSNKVRALLQSRVDRLSQMENVIKDPGKLLETLGDKGKFVETVKNASEKIIQLEIERIKKASNPNEFESILNFYKELLEENKKMRDGFFLRLGAQTGFFSKTFFTRFLNRKELEFLKSTRKVYRKINADLFPVSISIYESPEPKPLGWVRVRFVS
jgi:CRISPR-associated protein Csm5